MVSRDHPTVTKVLSLPRFERSQLSQTSLRALCLECGADDVGFVSIHRPEVDDQRNEILKVFPRTKTLISLVCKMNREPIKSPARSAANLEFHQATDHLNEVTRSLVAALEQRGYPALNPSAGFPMEMQSFPGKIWYVSHKPIAVAAGLGKMGIHRNVIHPKFGNFILLGTVLTDIELTQDSTEIDYNPCLECKLCVAACPVGAIKSDGAFDAGACMTHNYREFMGGFTEWIETVAESKDARTYRQGFSDSETASMWQSLSFGANYKAAYCLAVCPAGEDVIGPYLADKSRHLKEVVKPLQEKSETVYVVPDSDAAEHVRKRFPHKVSKEVRGLRPASVRGFVENAHIAFQSGKAKGVDAVFHFAFRGKEPLEATFTIRDQKLTVESGLHGRADCTVRADSDTWLGFLRKEKNIVWSVLTGGIGISGRRLLMKDFARCFPS